MTMMKSAVMRILWRSVRTSLFYSGNDLELDLMNLEDPMKIPLLPFSDSGEPEFELGLNPTYSLPLETLKQKENRYLAYAMRVFNKQK